MPEFPVNAPLTPKECVEHVYAKVDSLIDLGICESCALKLVSADLGIDSYRMRVLYFDHKMTV